jgi:HEAT repeat protein
MQAREHDGEEDAAPSVIGRRGVRAGLRLPAMLWPYVGLIGGTLLLARADPDSFARFWWLAPAAVLAYAVVLSLTCVSMATRHRRARAHDDGLELVASWLRSSMAVGEDALRAELEPVMGQLRDVQRACVKHLSDAESDVVRAALIAAGAHDGVAQQLRRASRKRRRANAIFLLGWLRDERSVPVLAKELNGHDADLAYVAGQVLAEYESTQACHSLVTALQTGTLPRPLVATLLEGSRCAGASELVAAASGDPDARVRSWVAYLLGRYADPRARTWLAALAADENADVRASAAEAYAAFPDAPVLTALLRDGDWGVRANAAKAIGNAGLADLAANLTELMSDRTWWVRQSAAIALKQLGQASVGHLRRLLDDDDRFVRNKAAEVLIEVGFISEQIAALSGTPEQVAAAHHVLAAVVRADARATLTGSIAVADPATRERLVALLAGVDGSMATGRLAAA